MLPPIPPAGFELFRMPMGMASLQQIRRIIGLDALYHRLKILDLLCYSCDGSTMSGVEPHFWDTPVGREVIEATDLVEVGGKKQLYIVSIPSDINEIIEARQAAQLAEQQGTEEIEGEEASETSETATSKRMRDADIERAIALLKEETLTKRLTRIQAREFLRPHFSDRNITERNFQRIFKHVGTQKGRPQKGDNEV